MFFAVFSFLSNSHKAFSQTSFQHNYGSKYGRVYQNRYSYQNRYRARPVARAGKITKQKPKMTAAKKQQIKRQKKVAAIKNQMLRRKQARMKKIIAREVVKNAFSPQNATQQRQQTQQQATPSGAASAIGMSLMTGFALTAPRLLMLSLL